MKRKNIKGISLTLAAAAVFAAFGGATLSNKVATAAPLKKTISDVFSLSKAEVAPEDVTVGETTKKVTAFDVSDDGNVNLKRNLALKWFDGENSVKYFNLKFALATLDFKEFTISMDTPSAWATKDEKATNTLTFINNDGAYTVKINDETEQVISLTANAEIALDFAEGDEDGEFEVKLNGTSYGSFVNIGANYAQYKYNESNPLQFSFDFGEGEEVVDKKGTLLVYEINGQKFDNVLDNNAIEDTAAPVLVVNEELYGFLLGTQFALDYTTVDVLQDSNLSKSLEWYQYNPNYAEGDEKFEKYSTLTTSTYFYDTVYKVGEGANEKTTTVFKEEGAEFVSIKISVWDSTFNAAEGEYAKKVYDLAWYVQPERVNKSLDTQILYIPVDQNEEGPKYAEKYVKVKDGATENEADTQEEFEERQEVKDFYVALNKAAEDVYAGSNSYVYLPSMQWFIDDNNGYRNMKFTISYRAPGSDTASTSSSLSYNGLKIAATKEGRYEFKIFATDKKGNPMKYYYENELVDISTDNIWKIKDIPYFYFEIENKGLKVEDPTTTNGRRDKEVLEETYTFEDPKIIGATDLQKAYALYKIDMDAYNANAPVRVNEAHLIGVKYEQIAEQLAEVELSAENNFDAYLLAYAKVLAARLGGGTTATQIINSGLFVKICEEGDRINGKEEHDKYEWNATAKTFKTVEEGHFFVLADYWEDADPTQRATAYKVVLVESKTATIEGESQWWKDNLVSVILFSIAGVLLILVIVLLFIKPSDEKLEDLDKKVNKKEKKNKEDKTEE